MNIRACGLGWPGGWVEGLLFLTKANLVHLLSISLETFTAVSGAACLISCFIYTSGKASMCENTWWLTGIISTLIVV